MEVQFYKSEKDTFAALTDRLLFLMQEKGHVPFHLALSGGGTAQQLFTYWTAECRERIDWKLLRFYWVDERCVPPADVQSNYRYAAELLFVPLGVPTEHIFRIRGEEEPEQEAFRYSELVRHDVQEYDSLPLFDCIILGVGSDLHTASIFPASMQFLVDDRCYVESVHPETGQKRVTMTGQLILNAMELFFPIIGKEKNDVVKQLVSNPSISDTTPAGFILSRAERAIIFTDCML